jgi:hypothetical protein
MIRAALAVLAAVSAAAPVHAQSYSSDDLARRAIHRRAIEAVIWGMPAVNFDLMLQAMSSAWGKPNQIVYWSRLPDWKNQTLTPNPDVIYVMPFFNTKDAGPMVLEIPPADDGLINGTVMDAWQVPLEDVGPAGVDKGKGGKYLIVPPNHSAAIPDGYIPLPSMNHQGYALLRSILKSGSDADVAKAVTYAKRIKLYPLSQATNPPATTFVDAIDIVYDSTIPYDLRFFQSLDRIVQMEPWLARDKLMVDILKSIGIVKGKPFNPAAQTQDVLMSAAREAKALLESRYEGIFTTSYFESSRWAMPALPDYIKASQDGFSDPSAYPFDSLIRDMPRSGRGSQSPGLQKNADGSVDIYFGPKAPAGMDSNWVSTNPGGQFEVLFRFYGPEKPLFDKTWKLPDIEKVVEAASFVAPTQIPTPSPSPPTTSIAPSQTWSWPQSSKTGASASTCTTASYTR